MGQTEILNFFNEKTGGNEPKYKSPKRGMNTDLGHRRHFILISTV